MPYRGLLYDCIELLLMLSKHHIHSHIQMLMIEQGRVIHVILHHEQGAEILFWDC